MTKKFRFQVPGRMKKEEVASRNVAREVMRMEVSQTSQRNSYVRGLGDTLNYTT